MKHAVTFRIQPKLLAAARQCAVSENRSLTNFVETVLMHHITNRSEERLADPRKPAAVRLKKILKKPKVQKI